MSGTSQPRILIQNGNFELDNLGELAMLQAAIDRIRRRLPDSHISVFTRQRDALIAVAPDATPLPVEAQSHWELARSAYLWSRIVVPAVDSVLRRGFPRLYSELLRIKARSIASTDALFASRFIVFTGGAYFNDVFPGQAWSSIERMRAAAGAGVPFAIMGQAFSHIRDTELRRAAAEMIPQAKLISIRERLKSVSVLEELGVDITSVCLTGDDAVGRAWHRRKAREGRGLGLSIRIAPYAGMHQREISEMSAAVRAAIGDIDCEVVPLPVCIVESVESASDVTSLVRIMKDLPQRPLSPPMATTHDQLIDLISECRIVVTGSYHCAVFALSQGIPAVCIQSSEYYDDKFKGLADRFGAGCDVVDRTHPDFPAVLGEAVTRSWSNAGTLRAQLLEAAREQVEAADRAYDRLCSMIASD